MHEKSPLINKLNEAQCRAVTTLDANLLILAGAGSGKTRVLVHRIAWLVETQGISPHEILALTFTNKAANEMKTRIASLLEYPIESMWVGTFHGLAHRLLRMHWSELGLEQNFQILDSDDQKKIIKRIIKALNLPDNQFPPQQVQSAISQWKEAGLRFNSLPPPQNPYVDRLLRVYQEYEAECRRNSLVDFTELLLLAKELFQNNLAVREHYQRRFRHILVDEFQDTNGLQDSWLRLLITPENNFTMVGDDDQSIYGWRGARIEHIQNLAKSFPGLQTIRLEQNYRSSKNILQAANKLIENNRGRLGKSLWTEGEDGRKIVVYAAFNEQDEARFVIDRIAHWKKSINGRRFSAAAILYRSNAQSRVFEEQLIAAKIPYRIYGGQRFFDRAEIKDALAYLRLLINRNDDPAFERIINWPTRGIGERSIDDLREYARAQACSLWQASAETLADKPARTRNAILGFRQLIEELSSKLSELSLAELVAYVIQRSGLLAVYQADREKGETKAENLQELVTASQQFKLAQETDRVVILREFLAQAVLDAGEDNSGAHEDSLNLMTVHAAKGLEFDLVWLVGLEEGLFPHEMSRHDPKMLEEERRLCYVGMTRARFELGLSYAEVRRLHGREQLNPPSRFLAEIPEDLLDPVRFKALVKRPLATAASNYPPAIPVTTKASPSKVRQASTAVHSSGLRLGQRVRHAKFGEGYVLSLEGNAEATRVQVNFLQAGTKWLMLNLAKLETI